MTCVQKIILNIKYQIIFETQKYCITISATIFSNTYIIYKKRIFSIYIYINI